MTNLVLWPIELVKFWFSDQVAWWMLAFPITGMLGGALVGTWRFAASRDVEDVGAITACGILIGLFFMFLTPLLLFALWFGWPLILAWFGFYRLAVRLNRPEPPRDPELEAAYRELEREGL